MSSPIRVLELRSVRGTGGGPEKTILSGALLADPARYAITVCYIRDRRDAIFAVDGRAAQLGVDYVEIPERHSFDPSIWPALKRLVRERRIDIVHAHEYKTDLCAWLLSKVTPVIPLATLHGYTGNSRREQLYYAADKRLVRRFPKLIAVSEALRNDLVRSGCDPARIVCVPNCIDDRAFRRDDSLRPNVRASLGLSETDIVVGAVGRLEQQKRFDVLMRAVRTLRDRPGGHLIRLIIVGDGSLRQALEDERARLGLEDACLLLGHRSDVVALHHAFDVFVQSSDYEGTSNAVLEAMALETPIIATDAGGTIEMITDNIHGLIVPSGSSDAIVAALDRVFADMETTRRRVVASRLRVEGELSFRSRMVVVERIYDTLVAAKPQHISVAR